MAIEGTGFSNVEICRGGCVCSQTVISIYGPSGAWKNALTSLRGCCVDQVMLLLRKSKSNAFGTAIALIIAVAIFVLPQGVCLKTLLGDDQCCAAGLLDLASDGNDDAKPCCKMHDSSRDKKPESDSSTSKSSGCLWTSTASYLPQTSHGFHDVVTLEPINLTWLTLVDIQAATTMAVTPAAFLDRELAAPALRRGSSILRI